MNSLQPPPETAEPKKHANALMDLTSVAFAARLLSFCLLAGLLYWGRVVAIPLALAILLSFTLKPMVRRLGRWHVPRGISVIGTVGSVCAIVGCVGWLIGSQLVDLSEQLPAYRANIAAKVKSLRGMMKGGTMEKIQGTMEKLAVELEEDKGPPPVETPSVSIGIPEDVKPIPVFIATPKKLIDLEVVSALLPVLDPLTTAALVLVLVVLMLLRWEDLRSRIISFSGHQNLTIATRACDDAGRRITRYLMMQLLLNGSYGLVFAVGLYLVGVPYATLWGLCAALFRYLPYVGPIAGAALPIVYSLVTSDTWTQPLWVAGIILGLELVSNNVLEPWLYGSRLGISEVGIIISAVAWYFLWGPVGLVLATPLTVCLVVLGEYLPSFSIFARLLGDLPVLDMHFRFYQRLLAHDEVEAAQIARRECDEHGLEATIDDLIIPALALAERDEAAGILEPEDQVHLHTAFGKVFEQVKAEEEKKKTVVDPVSDLDAEMGPPRELAEDKPRVQIIIWPVVPLANNAATLLKWSLRETNAEITVLSPETLSSEAGDLARSKNPAAFCVLSLAGAQVKRERQLTKRMVTALPAVPVIVARLGPAGMITTEVRDELMSTGATSVVHTLKDTCAAIRPFVLHAAMDAN
jgi:predicted PurR-regulated permease PerM